MFYIMISSSSIHIDAEHPTFIPMYTPTTLRAPRGHMTRPRAYAIGHKVNSILSKPSLSSRETWLLLQARTLCILRYTRGDHGEPKDQGRACAEAWTRRRKKKNGARQDLPGSSGHPAGRSGPSPDDPDDHPDDPANVPEDTRSCSTKPDHPDGHPDHPDPRHPDHPGHPDHPDPACVRDLGRSPCTPSPLTYPFVA